MKSVILYSSPRPTDRRAQQITLPDGEKIFIRAEVVSNDLLQALDSASPQIDETVLNSIPHPSSIK